MGRRNGTTGWLADVISEREIVLGGVFTLVLMVMLGKGVTLASDNPCADVVGLAEHSLFWPIRVQNRWAGNRPIWRWPGAGERFGAAAAGRGGGRAADPGLGGTAGADQRARKLHVRLVVLFSGVAVAPTIVVAVFRHMAFFQPRHPPPGSTIRVRDSALHEESLQVSASGYLDEHRNNVRTVALSSMSNDLVARRWRFMSERSRRSFGRGAGYSQTTFCAASTEAVIYEPYTGQVMAAAGAIFVGMGVEAPPDSQPHSMAMQRRCRGAERRRWRPSGCGRWCGWTSTAPR